MKDMIRIANGQGFWGDSIDAPFNLVTQGPIDYLTLDYLAEVTMSIMQSQRQRDAGAGFARDFPEMLRTVLPVCVERDIKIVTNAGGVNAEGCVDACRAIVNELSLGGLNIGVVEGDDILGRLDELIGAGATLANMETGKPLANVRDSVVSANVYLDTLTIAEALSGGAHIVLTGRTTDPGLVLGPMIHEFGWKRDDWDLLAAGTVAGHILECGAQATGGNFSRWQDVPDLTNIGYPIVEAYPDGRMVITKHESAGGMVTVDTVSEQLLYELGDPKNYITPDVVVDFTSIKIEQVGPNRVGIGGVKGSPATPTFKASINYSKGWKATGQLSISGPKAIAKAHKVVDIIFSRLAAAGFTYQDTFSEIVGRLGPVDSPDTAMDCVNSIVLVVGVKDEDKGKVDRFGKELAPVITNGPPGITGFAAGRPKARPIVAFWPALIDKSLVSAMVKVVEI
ncbi:acyclic terpene utilization AtuA family protein [Candidatus Neomarinimicrobiota bacterium]